MSISFPFGQQFFSSGRFLGAGNNRNADPGAVGATGAQGIAAAPTRGGLMQGIGGMEANQATGAEGKSGKKAKGKSGKSGKSGSGKSGSGQNAQGQQGQQGNLNPMQMLQGLRAMMIPGQQPQAGAPGGIPQPINPAAAPGGIPQPVNPAVIPGALQGGIPIIQAAPNPFAAIDARINGGLANINGLLTASGIQPETRFRVLNPNLPI